MKAGGLCATGKHRTKIKSTEKKDNKHKEKRQRRKLMACMHLGKSRLLCSGTKWDTCGPVRFNKYFTNISNNSKVFRFSPFPASSFLFLTRFADLACDLNWLGGIKGKNTLSYLVYFFPSGKGCTFNCHACKMLNLNMSHQSGCQLCRHYFFRLIWLCKISWLPYSTYVFHDKAKRIQQGDLLGPARPQWGRTTGCPGWRCSRSTRASSWQCPGWTCSPPKSLPSSGSLSLPGNER